MKILLIAFILIFGPVVMIVLAGTFADWHEKQTREKEKSRQTPRQVSKRKELKAYKKFGYTYNRGKTPQETAVLKQHAEETMNACLNNNICPECGHKLEREAWDNNSENFPEFYEFNYCTRCKLRTDTNEEIWW